MSLDPRELLRLLGGARRHRTDPTDDAVAVAARASNPYVAASIGRTRVSPFTTDLDLRIYLPRLAAEQPGTIAEVVEAAAMAAWRSSSRHVDAINLDIVLDQRRPEDRLGDGRAMRVSPLEHALGPGVLFSWRRLTFPEAELVRRFGARPQERSR
ncbi:hypothetical protein EQW78_10125 [Oerskovia turbata]|uniref:Uncharacterized protein n=1 Tax=Oerskovia turbata TaxID=1713 RepID=A0A4Q1KWA9_9CELL|nr:hypothetical protein [Oerskovia turbata]RXR25399.1 hypothetical protein EQW73_11190 [Oerskovia turbata]RXR33960.1 hypothetical protein EQW78_10125 [Oerskovia turbata]TGJ95665.1 hypothetical protein DLJ96_14200 [Actinotalea fermentans ATCC 43279 = JCM 9966 = DSM 3133]